MILDILQFFVVVCFYLPQWYLLLGTIAPINIFLNFLKIVEFLIISLSLVI